MSTVNMMFTASINADKIYIDYSNLPDPISHKFVLNIQNQSVNTLYFKILSYISNWSITDPSNGQLDYVSSGDSKNYIITMSRSRPSGEVTDAGYLRVQAFTDSGYANKIGEVNLGVTVYIEDLENWTDVIINSFDDGTTQGWTISPYLSVVNDRSIEAGGYSLKTYMVTGGTSPSSFYLEKTMTLPNRNKVRINFYKSLRFSATSSYSINCYLRNVSVKVSGNKTFDIPSDIIFDHVPIGQTHDLGWYKFTADLSAYKGQTVTVRIEWQIGGWDIGVNAWSWLDRVVIAGKD